MKIRNSGLLFLAIISSVWLAAGSVRCEETQEKKEEFAGEFQAFGMKVPLGNYYVVKGAIFVFGNRWAESAQTEQQLEDQVWDQLLLSYEAFRRNITVDDKELEAEITKTLANEKVTFDRTKDKEAYAKWVKEKTQEPVELFENQLRHLAQLEKLRQSVMDTMKPSVTEEEAHQKFLDEYNSLELELVQCDTATDAEAFYNKMKNPKLWDAQAKKNPKFARYPGFVSLEFLINMWGIPRLDAYKMLKLEVNSIYPPTKIYKGHYGVFRILKTRPASEADFTKLRDSYFKQVETIKKYEGVKDWLKKLREEAKIVIYPKPANAQEKVKN